MASKNTNLLDQIVEMLQKEGKPVTRATITSRTSSEFWNKTSLGSKLGKITPGAVSKYCTEKGIN